jgi:hypothetical protein
VVAQRRTAADSTSGLFFITSAATFRTACTSPCCTATDARSATASQSSLRPWRTAAVPLGINSSACAASKTLSVSAATPELSRVVAESLFIPFPFPFTPDRVPRGNPRHAPDCPSAG